MAAGVILAAAARPETGKNMLNRIKTVIKHLWLDTSDARRVIPVDMLKRLAGRIKASEAHHIGEIRMDIEASMPLSYLWRLGQLDTMKTLIRQRAVMQFSKLRVWDTAHNSGVLIYLQLAERAIEIVADRGVAAHVTDAQWQAMVERMQLNFQQGHFEDGLTQALEEVSALLVMHFPAGAKNGDRNELPDEPTLN